MTPPPPESAGPTVAEIDEQDLIARITTRLPVAPDWLLVGPGDDGAVVSPKRNALEVVTTDVCVEGVHFDRRFCPPDAIGQKALAGNMSDLAAMGAEPRAALLSLMLPPALDVADLDGMIDGLLALAAWHKVAILGGNITTFAQLFDLLIGNRKCDRDTPGSSIYQPHATQHGIVVRGIHEAFERRICADGNHLQIGNRAGAELQLRHLDGPIDQAQFERVCALSDVDAIVSEAAPPKRLAASLKRAGVRVIVATD